MISLILMEVMLIGLFCFLFAYFYGEISWQKRPKAISFKSLKDTPENYIQG